MTPILAGFGVVFIAIILAVTAFLVWRSWVDARDDRSSSLRYEGSEFRRKMLAEEACWFSEDPVMEETLRRFALGSVENARAYWRKNRKVAPNLPTRAAGGQKGPRQPKVAWKRRRKAKK